MKNYRVVGIFLMFVMLMTAATAFAQTVSQSIGTLPAGKSVTITFDVTVNTPFPVTSNYVAAQGSVSGSFGNMATDDPDAGGAADSTKTAIGVAPIITTQPADQTVCIGSSVTFKAVAGGVPWPTVQWRVSSDGGTTWNSIPGATDTVYTFTAGAEDHGKKYHAVFANASGVDSTTNATLALNLSPVVTTHPHDSTVVTGAAVSFSAEATGTPTPTVRWQVSTDGGTGWSDLSGESGVTLAFTATSAQSGYKYRALFTNSCAVDVSTVGATLTVNVAPAITSVDSAVFTTGSAGSFTVAATGNPTPSLSKTGSLPDGVTFTDNGDGTATLSGTPSAGTGGTYTLSITAANGVSPDATQSFTLSVSQAPAITSADTTAFVAGSAGTFTITTTGFPTAGITLSNLTSGSAASGKGAAPTVAIAPVVALPSGVTFTDNGDGTGTLSGTPAAGTGGLWPFVVTAGNGVGTDATQDFTLTVTEYSSITSADSAVFTAGSSGSFTVTTAGYPASSIADSGTVPSGLTFTDNGDGTATLSGTPSSGTGGRYLHAFTASNGVGTDAHQSFSLIVNEASAVTSVDSTTFTAGSSGSFTITAAGYPVPGFTIDETPSSFAASVDGKGRTVSFVPSVPLPSGVTFTDNGDGTATLAGTPATGTGKVWPFTVTASNGIGTDAIQNFTLTVLEAPSITSNDSTAFTAASAGSFTVTTAGYPVPALSSTGTLPSGISFTDNGDGTATLSGTAPSGTAGEFPLTLTAANGVGTDATQSFTLTLIPDYLRIIATSGSNGSISPSDTVQVFPGNDTTFTFTPQTGFHVDSIFIDGVGQGAAATYTFSAVSVDHTIHVTFAIDTFVVTASAGLHGSITPSGTTTVDYGSSLSFTITPDDHYHIDSIIVDGVYAGNSSPFTLDSIMADRTISVTFAIDRFTVTAAATGQGTINPSGTDLYDYGSTPTYTITPDPHHHIVSVLLDSVDIGTVSSYTFDSLSADHTLEAVFGIDSFFIAATAGLNGSISPSDTVWAPYGTTPSFTLTPDLHYHIDSIFVDGVYAGAASPYTFDSVKADHSIHATFALDSLTVTAQAGPGGTISPEGTFTVPYGAQPVFTLTPDSHYHIDSILVNGLSAGTTSPVTLDSVIAPVTVEAKFKIDSVLVLASAGTGGSISPSGMVPVPYGDSARFTITPLAAYHIDSVLVNDAFVGTGAEYTFSSVTDPGNTIRVVFKKNPYNHSLVSGNWSATTTWSYGTLPVAGDSVIISSGTLVTCNANATSGAVTILGTLEMAGKNRQLTVTTSGGRSGDFVNSGIFTFKKQDDQRVSVAGNFASSGTLNFLSTGPMGSQFTFTGTGVHTMSTSSPLKRVILNGTNLWMQLLQPLTVDTQITLLNGKLVLGASPLITRNAAVDTGNAGSYVVANGPARMVRTVTTAFTVFPVGTDSSFTRVELATSSGTSSYGVSILPGVVPVSPSDSSALGFTVDIGKDTTALSGPTKMRLTWSKSDESAFFNRSVAVSWRHDGTAWVEEGFVSLLDTVAVDGTGPSRFRATVENLTEVGHIILGNPGALPVEMTTFDALVVAPQQVKLHWTTLTESNAYGFYIERREEGQKTYTVVSDLIAAAGTSLEEHTYSWTDEHATAASYTYRLKMVDLDNAVSYSRPVEVSTVLGAGEEQPLVFALQQNYPNPFNPATTINYSIKEAGMVQLIVYNMLGQEIARLVNAEQPAGRYSVQWNATELPSGSYFYRLVSGTGVQIKRLVLIK